MSKTVISSPQAPAPIGPYSQGIASGDLVFLSGQIALNPDTGELEIEAIESETHRVMKNISALLQAAGCSFDSVLKSSIFLRDMNDFAAMNEVYGSYFSGDYPARECVQVSVLPKHVNVEISIIARR